MAKTRPPYTPEFRRQMVELVRAGRSTEELAREFEPTAQSIKNWVAQAECDAGHGDGGLTTLERGPVQTSSGSARLLLPVHLLAWRLRPKAPTRVSECLKGTKSEHLNFP